MRRTWGLILAANLTGAMSGVLVGFVVAIKVILVQRELIEADVSDATGYLVWLPLAAVALGYAIGIGLWMYMRWRERDACQ